MQNYFGSFFFFKYKVKTNGSVSVTEKTLDGYIRTENFVLKISLKYLLNRWTSLLYRIVINTVSIAGISTGRVATFVTSAEGIIIGSP